MDTEYTREPCPWRMVDDCGGAFTMGAVGGSLFHGYKGFRNSPTGLKKSFYGGITNIQQRTPVLAGNFAVWGGLFSLTDCTCVYFRQKEDPWNSIISGAVTGGILSARSGVPAIISSALVGGILLALIEGMGIAVNKFMNDIYRNGYTLTRDETENSLADLQSQTSTSDETQTHESQPFL